MFSFIVIATYPWKHLHRIDSKRHDYHVFHAADFAKALSFRQLCFCKVKFYEKLPKCLKMEMPNTSQADAFRIQPRLRGVGAKKEQK